MIRRRARRIAGAAVVRLASLPPDVVGWCFVLVVHAMWGQRRSFGIRNGVLVAELRADSWPTRTWFSGWAGFAIGHAVLFSAGRARERMWKHEKVHIDQCEASQCASALAGSIVFLLGYPVAAAVVWALGYALAALGSSAAAWLRGGDAYFDSMNVRAAYALESGDDDAEVTRRSRRPAKRG